MKSLYTEDFYKSHEKLAYTSACRYVDILKDYFVPNSVVDIGCGRGIWLNAFESLGVSKLVGVDGSWNRPADMVSDKIQYHAHNLTQPILLNQKFDLAMSVEVAEHLPVNCGFRFVESLTALADVIIFGAACPRQGGIGHLNEMYHSEWADFFSSWGYEPFDIFRSKVWLDDSVAWWYQQNTFLYVHTQHQLFYQLQQKNIMPMANKNFMNCIHPYLYAQKKDA